MLYIESDFQFPSSSIPQMGLSVKEVGVKEGFASALESVDFVIFLHYYPRQKQAKCFLSVVDFYSLGKILQTQSNVFGATRGLCYCDLLLCKGAKL